MNWQESIDYIRDAQENNRLVIFVGAGVSMNSKLPSWYGLIKKIADELKFSNCIPSCSGCNKSDCSAKNEFTQEDFLKIPEYYYSTVGDKTYYDFIQNHFLPMPSPNEIDKLIISLLPHHIITTNYDTLLEDVESTDATLYSVIAQDHDLLSKINDRYIIKMHGDIHAPKTIVLKESDYTTYESTHPLISTFIRSLLINHTFLFVGYSLNDYNLKIIMGWINYYVNLHRIKERPHSFIITDKKYNELESNRLELQQIFPICTRDMPQAVIKTAQIPTSLTKEVGQLLYVYLKCIKSIELQYAGGAAADALEKKYAVLKEYNKISYYDLLRAQSLGPVEMFGFKMMLYDPKWYDIVTTAIQNSSTILEIFQRANITCLCLHGTQQCYSITPPKGRDRGFRFYLTNRFEALLHYTDKSKKIAEKIFYYRYLCKDRTIIEELCSAAESQLVQNQLIEVLLHKYRCRLATITYRDLQEEKSTEIRRIISSLSPKYSNSVKYFEELSSTMAAKIVKMQRLLDKHEKRYEYHSSTYFSGDAFSELYQIQAIAYDYYFYFHENNLPIFYFSDPKTFFEPYIQAILCTYSPATVLKSSENDGLIFLSDRKQYQINAIDLDIITKYCDPKLLRTWIKKYSVQQISINPQVHIVNTFVNLVDSMKVFRIKEWINHLRCYIELLKVVKLTKRQRDPILVCMIDFFCGIEPTYQQYISDVFQLLCELTSFMSLKDSKINKSQFLDSIISSPSFQYLSSDYYTKMRHLFNKLSPFVSKKTARREMKLINTIAEQKNMIKRICLLYPLFSKKWVRSKLKDKYALISTEELFYMVVDKTLPWNEHIISVFMTSIRSEWETRKHSPHIHPYPDPLENDIAKLIILHILGYKYDVMKLRPFVDASVFIEFVINPESFDYSKVDTSHYMWQNLIYSSVYQDYFIKHKQELLTENIQNIFKLGMETKEQSKIIYGILLNKDELYMFGK